MVEVEFVMRFNVKTLSDGWVAPSRTAFVGSYAHARDRSGGIDESHHGSTSRRGLSRGN
jgi:hypothetical protein